MTYLDKNATAYNSYFEWKKHIVFQKPIKFGAVCEMCIQLNLESHLGIKKNIVTDVGKLWNKKNCEIPNN